MIYNLIRWRKYAFFECPVLFNIFVLYLPKRLLQTKVLEKERGLLTGIFHGIRIKILPVVLQGI